MSTDSPGLADLAPRDLTWHPPALTPDYRSSRARAPGHKLLSLPPSGSTLCGPVFGHDLLGPHDHDLIVNYAAPGETAIGPRILVHGRVIDEDARPVPGALVEVWQANAGGRYRHRNDTYLAPIDPNFGGCGRVISDADGRYEFRTIKPAPYPWPNGVNFWRPAHIHISVFGQAFAQRLITQMYFEGDPLIRLCPIVQAIPDPAAVETLIAPLDMEATLPHDMMAYRFDIVLRGRASTMFENRMEGN